MSAHGRRPRAPLQFWVQGPADREGVIRGAPDEPALRCLLTKCIPTWGDGDNESVFSRALGSVTWPVESGGLSEPRRTLAYQVISLLKGKQ